LGLVNLTLLRRFAILGPIRCPKKKDNLPCYQKNDVQKTKTTFKTCLRHLSTQKPETITLIYSSVYNYQYSAHHTVILDSKAKFKTRAQISPKIRDFPLFAYFSRYRRFFFLSFFFIISIDLFLFFLLQKKLQFLSFDNFKNSPFFEY